MKKIVIIGSGNVAWHLCKSFMDAELDVLGVYSKTEVNRNTFANEFQIQSFSSLREVNEQSPDVIILAINDDYIAEVAQKINKEIPLAYTSGSVELSSLERPNTGVFYPLQSFTRGQKVNLFEVPFFIESTDIELSEKLFQLAWKISNSVQFADSKTRSELHLAAVFANNFSNHMFTVAKDLLKNSEGEFKHLMPLIKQSIDKLASNSPSEIQTGPAKRGDKKIINKHIEKLNPEYAEIYKVISASIQKRYNEEL